MSNVAVEVEDDIAIVTFDRPPVNAIDRPAMSALKEALDSLNDRRDVRVASSPRPATAPSSPVWT